VNNWKVIFATVVIFGAGVITGGLLVNHVQHSHSRSFHKLAAPLEANLPTTNQTARSADAPKAHLPEILSKQFLQRLDAELHFTPEQHEAIQKIISESQSQMRKVIQDSRLQIRELLTPEQQVQFDELIKRPPHKPPFNTNAPSAVAPDTNAPATNAPPI
jgi:hypothetical protein